MKPGLRAQLISRLGPRLILLVAITISAVAVASTGARFSDGVCRRRSSRPS